nr:protein chibby homolog 1 isoform X2 [Halyomorpha halys]
MPFFGSKFSISKCSKRKKIPFRPEVNIPETLNEPLKIKLGSIESIFVDGEWKPEPNIELSRENEYLKEVSDHLKEENNLLKTKIEILIDMLTESTLDFEERKYVALYKESERI